MSNSFEKSKILITQKLDRPPTLLATQNIHSIHTLQYYSFIFGYSVALLHQIGISWRQN